MLSNYSVVAPESSGGYVQNQLVLHNLGRQDLRSQLTCHAANNNRTIPLTATVHVDMNCKYTPYIIIHKGKDTSSSAMSSGVKFFRRLTSHVGSICLDMSEFRVECKNTLKTLPTWEKKRRKNFPGSTPEDPNQITALMHDYTCRYIIIQISKSMP
ncbi:hypothetical protein AAG570_003201 [Ranatra chinensis]|uniref:Uncharacterized protein n=1 Tax=Ranatra chinensis TaxID=642074 RepID=A0ABD0Y666_9HEMI